jgi:hypothetical protein
MSPKPRFGPRRSGLLKGQVLGVSVRRAEQPPRQLTLTATRRGLLEAIAAGKCRWHPSRGWMCAGKAVNADIRDLVAAQWARERVADGRPQIALTSTGEAAIGREGSETA